MLSELHIKNIALIEDLRLNFEGGLNILSGETGAGKSIIIDSLNFVLGERADKSLIRYGTDFATVEAVFSNYQNPEIENVLNESGFEAEEILLISRKMTVDGKNECRINGRAVTLSMLKNLTEHLSDIVGQHEHQSLLKVSNHITLLDSTNENIASKKSVVKKSYRVFKDLQDELVSIGDSDERARKCDILSYQVKEIEDAKIYDGEEEELIDKRKKIRNMEKILSALDEGADFLNGGEKSALDSLKQVLLRLDSIISFDDSLQSLIERLENTKIELKDIASELNIKREELDYDFRSSEQIEERLDLVRKILKKYGGSFEKVNEFLAVSKAELEKLTNADKRVEDLQFELEKNTKTLVKSLFELSQERKKTAEVLEKKITKELSELGMAGSSFKVKFNDLQTDEDLLDNATENGSDEVEFLISPNLGEPLKPLQKIISGGEMSRFMLALKTILLDNIETVVFDEIDSGISGHIAEVVASKLCRISRHKQLLAVTHLPQLAAMADVHYLIEKHSENNKTVTNLTKLSDNLPEIARLIGGSDYSGYALPHAKKMKEWSDEYKLKLAK